ncbi:MAG: enoyl-CoA hydratase/isomerase family protein [Actinomycetota bacterium]
MTVRYEVKDHVAVVTIDRPEVLNAMNLDVFDGLYECGRRAAADPEARAVLVTGEGRAFSSGIDTTIFTTGPEGPIDIARLQRAFTLYAEIPLPTIAAVRGPCLGGGLQLAIACDLRVVADDARLSAFEINWGIIPDLGGTQRLPRLIGMGRAQEMVLTGRSVGGPEALGWGLANRCVSPEDVLDDAFSWASELAAGPPLALAAAKRLTATALDLPVHSGLRREATAQRKMLASEDFIEAVTAKMQKRPPEYRGR